MRKCKKKCYDKKRPTELWKVNFMIKIQRKLLFIIDKFWSLICQKMVKIKIFLISENIDENSGT